MILFDLSAYFRNCEVMIDNNLSKQFKDFITDAIHHHSFLKDRYQLKILEKEEVNKIVTEKQRGRPARQDASRIPPVGHPNKGCGTLYYQPMKQREIQ